MRIVPIAMAALIAVVGTSGPSAAQTKQARTTSAAGSVFTDIEKRIVDEYYRLKARVTGEDPAPPTSTAPKRASGTMRGIPKEVGSAEDDDGASKGKARGKAKGKSDEPPPGLAKKDQLPPGLEKKDQLPPGLAKKDKLPPGLKRDPLPADLAAKLPAPKPGTERLLIGDDLVLIDKKTSAVLDFIRGAALPKS